MSEYLGDGRILTLAAEEIRVTARRRVVDATYLGVVVPSMRPPPYDVADAVDCIPPNDLPKMRDARDNYVIVGAGKTAMDACLWLLRNGIPPQRLTWITPRESWLLDRAAIQPGAVFAKQVVADFAAQLTAIERAESIADLFGLLSSTGCLLRIDESIEPEKYRCAILSQAELDELRRIDNVVRMGHVHEIAPGRVELDGGSVTTGASALYVDCTGDGLGCRKTTTVFEADHITLQPVRTCQPVFSAAVIAHVEAAYSDDETKNAYCGPVPHPDVPMDWLTMTLAFNRNQMRWFADPDMTAWLGGARLNVTSHVWSGLNMSDAGRAKSVGQLSLRLQAANEKLEALLRDEGTEFD